MFLLKQLRFILLKLPVALYKSFFEKQFYCIYNSGSSIDVNQRQKVQQDDKN